MNEDLIAHADYSEFALSPESPEPHDSLEIPPKLIWEIAAGVEDPAIVAARYGFAGTRWERLSQWGPFIQAVSTQRSEFEREGVTFRLKAGMMAQELMDQMFRQASTNESTIMQKLSVFNAFVDVAGLKPEKKSTAQQGDGAPRFSITINVPQVSAATPVTIDAQ